MDPAGRGTGTAADLHLSPAFTQEPNLDPPTHNSRQGSGSAARGTGPPSQGGNRSRQGRHHPGLLLPPLLGPQARGEMETSDRSEQSQPLHLGTALQDGYGTVSTELCSYQRVRRFARPIGRLPPYTSSAGVASVSQVCHRRNSLRLQGDALWPKPSPMGLYQTHGSSDVLRKKIISSRYLKLFRRHLAIELRRGTPRLTFAASALSAQIIRVEGQSTEVRPDTLPGVCPLRDAIQDSYEPGVSDPKETGQDPSTSQPNSAKRQCVTSAASEFIRHAPGSFRVDPSRTLHPANTPVGGNRSAGLQPCRLGQNLSTHAASARRHLTMDRPGLAEIRGSSTVASPSVDTLHRRIASRLGSTSTATLRHCPRRVDYSRVVTTHKHSGDAGGRESNRLLAPPAQRPSCSHYVRQYDSVRLHKEPRRSALQIIVLSDSTSVAEGTCREHFSDRQTHPRQAQRHSRQPVTKSAPDHRVDATPRGLSADSEAVPGLADRPLRDTLHSTDASVCLAIPGRAGTECRRPDAGLVEQGPVRLPTHGSGSHSHQEAEERTLPHDVGGTVAVETELDDRSTSTNPGGPSAAAAAPGPSAAAGQSSVASQSSGPQSSCLEAVRRSLEAKGFSRAAIDRILRDKRASTIEVYNAKWTLFCQWCVARLLDPLAITPALLADYFLCLFEDKALQPITIRGYAAAITRIYGLCRLPSPCRDKTIAALLSNFENERPKCSSLVPRWSLDVVLDYLQSTDMADPRSLTIPVLTKKTVFLVAMATAFRVSELHALARDNTKLRWNQDNSVTLATRDGFIAKNKRPTAAGQQVTLQPLREQPDLCPVLHLRVYVEVTDCEEGSVHLQVSARSGRQDVSTDDLGMDLSDYPRGLRLPPHKVHLGYV